MLKNVPELPTTTTSRSARMGSGAARSSRALRLLAVLSALSQAAILGLVLGVIDKGFSQLELDFFTRPRPLFGEGGGVGGRTRRHGLIVGMAMLMAIPFSVLVAIYMSEYAGPKVCAVAQGRARRTERRPRDCRRGLRLRAAGRRQRPERDLRGVRPAILMLPMVARATQEILGVVPQSLRHASLALGVTRWRTTWNIILPDAIAGILDGDLSPRSRASQGETASHASSCPPSRRTQISARRDHRRFRRCRSPYSSSPSLRIRASKQPPGPLR